MTYKADQFLRLDSVTHGFFTRRGGLGEGFYESLNCGAFQKDPKAFENRALVANYLGLSPAKLMSVQQVHGIQVAEVTDKTTLDDLRQSACDAMITRTPGIGLGILTADCVPVLFADPTLPAVAAAHAGWRGALGGVLAKTVEALANAGSAASNIIAAIGPAIQQQSYEVGPEVHAEFTAQHKENSRFFKPSSKSGHYMLDLPGYVEHALMALDLKHIERFPHDTYANETEFFSYRRTTHRGETQYGCQISVIALKENV